MSKLKLFIVNSAFLLMALCSWAQSNRDFQFRFNPAIDYKLNKHWSFGAEYRISLYHQATTFKSNYFQGSATYKYRKHFSLEGGYRFSTSYSKDYHQLFAVVGYKTKISKRFELKNDLKYQFRTGSFSREYMQNYKIPGQYLRDKLLLEYNVPNMKLTAYAGAEFFVKLADPVFEWNRIRYHAGLEYAFKFGNYAGIGLFYEDRFNSLKTDRLVLVTKYKLSLDELIKKMKKAKKKAMEKS